MINGTVQSGADIRVSISIRPPGRAVVDAAFTLPSPIPFRRKGQASGAVDGDPAGRIYRIVSHHQAQLSNCSFGNLVAGAGLLLCYMSGSGTELLCRRYAAMNGDGSGRTTEGADDRQNAGVQSISLAATVACRANSLVTTSSIIIATIYTRLCDDEECPGGGRSRQLYALCKQAATAETRVNFLLIN